VKSESEAAEAPVAEATRGRDFDLNQIRSELKGIDRTVKLPAEEKADKDKAKENSDEVVVKVEAAEKAAERTTEKTPTKANVEVDDEMEDVYEFKEPEPFEFEVRGKRDSPVDSNKIGKRPLTMTSPSNKISEVSFSLHLLSLRYLYRELSGYDNTATFRHSVRLNRG